MKQLGQGRTELYRSPRDLVPSVPRSLSDVVTRAMAFDPKQRFATAKDMAEASAAAPRSPFPSLTGGARTEVQGQEGDGDRRSTRRATKVARSEGLDTLLTSAILDTERYSRASRADPKGPERPFVGSRTSEASTARDVTRRRKDVPTSAQVQTATPHGRRCGRLVTSPGRGPYMTIAFKGGRQGGGDQWREPSPGRVRVRGPGIQSFERSWEDGLPRTWGGFGQ